MFTNLKASDRASLSCQVVQIQDRGPSLVVAPPSIAGMARFHDMEKGV